MIRVLTMTVQNNWNYTWHPYNETGPEWLIPWPPWCHHWSERNDVGNHGSLVTLRNWTVTEQPALLLCSQPARPALVSTLISVVVMSSLFFLTSTILMVFVTLDSSLIYLQSGVLHWYPEPVFILEWRQGAWNRFKIARLSRIAQ